MFFFSKVISLTEEKNDKKEANNSIIENKNLKTSF
jgi:hypothetical protein